MSPRAIPPALPQQRDRCRGAA